jgi:hypothetical protein
MSQNTSSTKRVRLTEPELPCKKCPRTFTDKDRLRNHTRWHAREARRVKASAAPTVVDNNNDFPEEVVLPEAVPPPVEDNFYRHIIQISIAYK